MMERVFLARWTPCDRQAEREAHDAIQLMGAGRPWSRVFERRGVALWWLAAHEGSSPVILPGELGAVFGVLFHRAASASARMVSSDVSAADGYSWAEKGGDPLLRSCWGNYLAVLHDRGRDEAHVLRDPAGSCPAFHAARGSVRYVFTHASDFVRACAGAVAVDALGVQLFLAQSRLPTARTTMDGVTELLPGERLTMSRSGWTVETAWRPVPSGDVFRLADVAMARDALRGTLIDCARAWRSLGVTVAHRLSGGLDSSVALAALCAERHADSLVCINERPKDVPEGDETPYAKAAADRFGARLVEIEQSADDVDYQRVMSAESGARPAITELSFGSAGFVDAARDCGATVLTSGQGGDQIFQRGGAHFFPFDAVKEGLPLPLIVDRVVDAAHVSRKSAWSILSTTLSCIAFQRRVAQGVRIAANPFWALAVDTEIAAENARHPWAADAKGASPARAQLIRHLADVPYYHRPSLASCAFLQAPFLASQPVIELVLRMPSYFQALDGRDRSLVRSAFEADLPEQISRRRTKGDTTRHFARVVQRNWPFMRDLLFDGELVRAGLIDRTRLERALKQSSITHTNALSGLLNAVVAEAWLRRLHTECSSARQQPGALAGGAAEEVRP